MMALAIAHHIREQVVFPADVINVNPQYHFGAERRQETQYDYGEPLTVI